MLSSGQFGLRPVRWQVGYWSVAGGQLSGQFGLRAVAGGLLVVSC